MEEEEEEAPSNWKHTLMNVVSGKGAYIIEVVGGRIYMVLERMMGTCQTVIRYSTDWPFSIVGG